MKPVVTYAIMGICLLAFLAEVVADGFALDPAPVVLYSLGVMSYIERSRELATLKVLGFRSKKIGQLLISQNVWLTVIGVILGLPARLGTLYWMLTALAGEYEMKLMLGPLTYSVSILLTFGVSLLVGWMVARKNKKIDMVEALKSAE